MTALVFSPDRLLDFFIRNSPLLVAPDDRKSDSLLPALIQRTEHGIMLQHSGDHVIPLRKEPLDRDIQALCGVCRKTRCSLHSPHGKLCQQFPCLIDHPGGVKSRFRSSPPCIAQVSIASRTARFTASGLCMWLPHYPGKSLVLFLPFHRYKYIPPANLRLIENPDTISSLIDVIYKHFFHCSDELLRLPDIFPDSVP